MTLKNKDGSIYRLDGPNPLMKEQKVWGDFIVHNMKWDNEVLPDFSELQKIKTDFQLHNNFIEELDQAVVEKVNETPVNENKVISDSKPEMTSMKNKIINNTQPEKNDNSISKIFIHCLPAFFENKIDNVYGDNVKTIKYKSPFSFEGVILDQSDLTFKFWTQADNLTNQIIHGSIIYPKTAQKRWWRVQERFEKTNGWIIISYPSDFQPHFDI